MSERKLAAAFNTLRPAAGQPVQLARRARPAVPPRPAGTSIKPPSPPAKAVLRSGPGTELKVLIASLGLSPMAGCSCDKLAARMDAWGPEGCREHRDEILDHLRKEQAKRGWMEKAKAGVLAVTSGLAFHLNPLDPAAGLLDEAVHRAIALETKKAAVLARKAEPAPTPTPEPPAPT